MFPPPEICSGSDPSGLVTLYTKKKKKKKEGEINNEPGIG